MPWDGSGNYALPGAPNFPALAGSVIVSTYYNAVITDLSVAIGNALTRDGQGKPSANIDWNAKNLTNVLTFGCTTLNVSGNANIAGTITAANLGSASAATLDTDTTLAANSDTRTPSQKAIKAYVDNAVTGLLDLKGSTDCSGNPNYPAALKGDAYVVSVAGKIGGAAGAAVDIGDVYFAKADNAGGTQAGVGASWTILEHNLAGALLTANALSELAGVAATARSNIGARAALPSIQSVASNATVTPTFADDEVRITAQAANLTLANPTGTAAEGWGIVIRIKDNGAPRTITFDTQYRAVGISLPTTTVANKTLYIGMVFNQTDTKWDVLSIRQEA